MSYNSNTVDLAKLYKRTSQNGNEYFSGKMGMANVVMFKTAETSDTGQEIWQLKVSEPLKKPEQGRAAAPAHPQQEKASRPAQEARHVPTSRRSHEAPFDDEIPW